MSEKVGIGIDLGGTAIKYGLVTEDGTIIWNSKKPTKANSSREEIEQNIFRGVSEGMGSPRVFGGQVLAQGIVDFPGQAAA